MRGGGGGGERGGGRGGGGEGGGGGGGGGREGEGGGGGGGWVMIEGESAYAGLCLFNEQLSGVYFFQIHCESKTARTTLQNWTHALHLNHPPHSCLYR